MSNVEIRVGRNGSYYVKGDFKLMDHRGNEITYDGDEVYLCRCGQSGDKPFCDGTHKTCGFDGTFAERYLARSGS
jgi:CDGSH-type Zn-finger protein